MKANQHHNDLNRIETLLKRFETKNISLKKEIKTILGQIRNNISYQCPKPGSDYRIYQNIFEKAPVGILCYDKEGKITVVNNKSIELFESERKKIEELHLLNLPDNNIVEAIKSSLKGERSLYEGYYTSVTSGKTVPIRAIFHPLKNSEEKTEGGVGMIEDITERYEANEKLVKSELRYRSIFENKHKVMLIIDPESGSIVDANPAAIDYYGWTLDEFKQLKISDINTLSQEELKNEMEKAKRAKRTHFHFKHRLADGSVKDVEVFSGMVQIEGNIQLYSIITDITERLENQKQLRKFKLGIERSKNIIFITDKDGYFQYINPSFEKVYGYNFDELKGKTPRILKSGKQEDQFYNRFWNTILKGDVMEGEVVNRTKDGKLLTIEFTSNPIVDSDGELLGFIAIQDDITERKKMDQRIRQSLKEKEVLLGEIHHRVKNNLAIISGLLEMNLHHSDDESVKGLVRDSQLRIKSMAKIHEKLYESDTFSQIPFREYVEEMITEIQVTHAKEGFEPDFILNIEPLALNINQAIPCGLILNELVSNALKHAFPDRKNGTVRICLKKTDNRLNLCVEDDGVGAGEHFNLEEADTLGMTVVKISAMQLGADLEMQNTGKGFICAVNFEFKENQKGSSAGLIG
ncbi:MAG: PAS domain S-box protein [Balneolaceae bacterium]